MDDVFVLTLAIRRLMQNAGRTVLLDNWMGDPDELADLNLQNMLGAAAFFLPRRLRRRLRTMSGRSRKSSRSTSSRSNA